MSWEDSRQYCQSKYIDLLSGLPEDEPYLESLKASKAWVGLKRDPANSKPWSWIETR